MGKDSENAESGQSFEDSLRELEEILKELETSKVSLDDLISKYRRARECVSACRAKLDAAELKIRQLGDNGSADFNFGG